MVGTGGLGTEECPVEDQGTATPRAPGWAADPCGRHELRYWDGAAWTDHVSDAGVTGRDEPDRTSPWAAMAPTPTRPPGPSWAWDAPVTLSPTGVIAPSASPSPPATATTPPRPPTGS